jgi:hypothetical protein
LAGVIRKLVDAHFSKRSKSASNDQRVKAALSIIGLGSSGFHDVSENK